MGEYAIYNGESVKIGTCEDMYYLRADQRDAISGYDFGADVLGVIRFRFPFPDEDTIEPGQFADYSRGWKVPGGYTLPAELSGDEHHSLQFKHERGYLVSLPCPEQFGREPGEMFTNVPIGERGDTLRVGRNGFSGGGATVVQQAFRGGHLVTLLHCGSCGAVHRLDTIEDAEPVIEAFAAEASRTEWRRLDSDWDAERGNWKPETNYADQLVHNAKTRAQLVTIANRISAGYATRVPVPA